MLEVIKGLKNQKKKKIFALKSYSQFLLWNQILVNVERMQKPKNSKTNCTSYNGRNKEERKTTDNKEV